MLNECQSSSRVARITTSLGHCVAQSPYDVTLKLPWPTDASLCGSLMSTVVAANSRKGNAFESLSFEIESANCATRAPIKLQ